MKNQIATTIEQSKRLIACGVKPETADMCYSGGALSLMEYRYEIKDRDSRRENYEVIPAWNLSALLALLPQSIKVDSLEFDIEITAGWRVSYVYYDDILECFDATDIIECCVKAVEWLTKYGYKLNQPTAI